MSSSFSVGQEIEQSRPSRGGRSSLFGQIWQGRWDYLYIAPALIVMLLVIAYPIYYTFVLSFYKTPPSLAMSEKIFVGIDNYVRLLKSSSFHKVTVNTFVWTFWSTFFSIILGFGAALVLNREFIGRGLLRGLLLVPFVISAVAASYVWRWIYHSDLGILGSILIQLGLTDEKLNLLDNVDWVLPALIVVNVWKEFPFAMIMILAGLQTVPEQLLRAARVDGASPFNQFVHVTLPHLKGVLIITLLLLLVANLNHFTIPWIMTGGGPVGASDIWITQIYQIAFGRIRFGIASAYSVILFIVMVVLGYFYVRALTGGDEKRRAS